MFSCRKVLQHLKLFLGSKCSIEFKLREFFLMYLFFFLSLSFSKYIKLTHENVKDVFGQTSKSIFLEVMSPWCPHCHQFQPTWEKLSSTKEFQNRVIFATLDCHKKNNLCLPYDTSITPSFYWHDSPKSWPLPYLGSHSYESIASFIKKQFKSPLPELSAKLFDKFTQNVSTIPFFYFNISKSDKESLDIATQVAKDVQHLEIKVGYFPVENDSIPQLFLHHKEHDPIKYQGLWEKDKIVEWINSHQIAFLDYMCPSLHIKLLKKELGVFLYLMPKNHSYNNQSLSLLSEIGLGLSEKAPVVRLFCHVYQTTCGYLGVKTPASKIQLIYLNFTNKTFYKYPQPFEFNDIPSDEEKLKDYQDKKVKILNHWRDSVVSNAIDVKSYAQGPGVGHFRQFKDYYFNSRAVGGFSFYIMLLPYLICFICIIIFIFIVISDCLQKKEKFTTISQIRIKFYVLNF